MNLIDHETADLDLRVQPSAWLYQARLSAKFPCNYSHVQMEVEAGQSPIREESAPLERRTLIARRATWFHLKDNR